MPNRDQVERALALVQRPAELDYFFDRLTAPGWLQPLREAGRFHEPPEPIQEGAFVRFPTWSESRYLARVASKEPELVVDIIQSIPTTSNVRVHEDCVDAALAMPPSIAVRLLDLAKTWAQTTFPTLLPHKLGKLVAHYAQGGELVAALELARVLLAPQPDPSAAEKAEHRLSAEPRSRFGPWEYDQILREDVPTLVTAAGLPALKMLCDLLDSALDLAHVDQVAHNDPEDYTYIWRPAIEDRAENSPVGMRGPSESLIIAVRDAAENLVRSATATVEDVIECLESHKWRVFERVALHVLRLFAPSSSLTAERLADDRLFANDAYHHEYVLLAGAAFPTLPEAIQESILAWGDEGPDLPPYVARYESLTGSPPSEEIITEYIRSWRSHYFAAFRSSVPDDLLQSHPWLRDLDDTQDDVEFASRVRTWIGPTGPLELGALSTMPIPELVEFLRHWTPSNEFFAPSREGLGRTIAAAVTAAPDRFASSASQFAGLDEAYITGLLQGWAKAVEANTPFDWEAVLQFCATALSATSPSSAANPDAAPSRSEMRFAMVWLLDRGLSEHAGATEISFAYRQVVWSLLKTLTADPDPSSQTEQRHGLREESGDNRSSWDPAALAINTVRGIAMQDVIQYALWARRQLDVLSGESSPTPSFAQMPEVRETLGFHLDIENDPSLAVRSVYGRYLLALNYLSPRWVTRNLTRIFPDSDDERPYWEAAWRAYIRFSPPRTRMLPLLRAKYMQAAEQIGESVASDSAHPESAEAKLGQHLLAFYWYGALDIGPGSLIDAYFQLAPAILRSALLKTVGFWLRRQPAEEGPIAGEVAARLKRFWEWRVAVTAESFDAKERSEELSAFGDWFSSGAFDDSWALDQLAYVLRQGCVIQGVPLVLDRLTATALLYPEQTGDCLRFMIGNEKIYDLLQTWQDRLEAILGPMAQAEDPQTRKIADVLINLLAAYGYRSIGKLLKPE